MPGSTLVADSKLLPDSTLLPDSALLTGPPVSTCATALWLLSSGLLALWPPALKLALPRWPPRFGALLDDCTVCVWVLVCSVAAAEEDEEVCSVLVVVV